MRVDLRIMVPVKTTKDQPVSKLKRKLRDSAADVEPLELPDREHEPTDVDDVPPLSRVPAGVRELDPADQAAAAELPRVNAAGSCASTRSAASTNRMPSGS